MSSSTPPTIPGDSNLATSRVSTTYPNQVYGPYTTWKKVVVAVATSNITTLAGLLTVDGVTLALNDRVLLTAQTGGITNGIYNVKYNGWQRANDLQLGTNASGLTVLVNQGTVNADSVWVCTNTQGLDIVGTSVLVFSSLVGLLSTVSGPGSSTNNAIAVWNGTTGTKLSNTALVLSPSLVPTTANAPLVSSIPGVLSFNNIAEVSVSVILTASQVTGASATPVQLVAAPGSGFILRLASAVINTRSTGNTPFAGGGVAIIQYGNTALGAGTNALSATFPAAEITAAASQIYMLGAPNATVLTTSNTGLFFSNQTGPFTGGTGTTLAITLNYQVLTFA